MENYFKLSFPFVYTQHCKIMEAIYIREGGGGRGHFTCPLTLFTNILEKGLGGGYFNCHLTLTTKKKPSIQNKILLAVKR